MLENVQFQRWFFWKIFGGIAPRPPYWGGATAPLPRPCPLGAPALRASRASLVSRDLRSLHRQAVIWDDFRHTNPEMLPAPLYATECDRAKLIGLIADVRCRSEQEDRVSGGSGRCHGGRQQEVGRYRHLHRLCRLHQIASSSELEPGHDTTPTQQPDPV